LYYCITCNSERSLSVVGCNLHVKFKLQLAGRLSLAPYLFQGTYELDTDIMFLTYFNDCHHSWLAIPIIFMPPYGHIANVYAT